MSGGHFNYEDFNFCDDLQTKLPLIFEALEKVFHNIDWAESGDTSRKEEEVRNYDILLELGERLFNR